MNETAIMRDTRRTAGVTLGVVGFLIVWAGLAWACTAVNSPYVQIQPNQGAVGTSVDVSGGAWAEGTVELQWRGPDKSFRTDLGQASVSEDGNFRATFQVPAENPDIYYVRAVQGEKSAQTPFEVTRESSSGGDDGSSGPSSTTTSGGDPTQEPGRSGQTSTTSDQGGQQGPSGSTSTEVSGGSSTDSPQGTPSQDPPPQSSQDSSAATSPQPSGSAPAPAPEQGGQQPAPSEGSDQPAASQPPRQSVGQPQPSGPPAESESPQQSVGESQPSEEPAAPQPADQSVGQDAASQPSEPPSPASSAQPAEPEAGEDRQPGGVTVTSDSAEDETDGSAEAPATSRQPDRGATEGQFGPPSARSGLGDLWSGFDASDAPALTPSLDAPADGSEQPGQAVVLGLGLVAAGMLLLLTGGFAVARRRLPASATTTRADRRA